MENPSSQDAASLDSIRKSATALTVGVLVWLLALAVTPKFVGVEFFFGLPQFWVVDFLVGGLVTVLLLSAYALAGRIKAAHFLAACACYFLPASLAVVAGDTVSSIFVYPLAREALHADACIIMPLMYCLGLLFAWWLLVARKKDFFVGFVLPPVVMACLLVGLWAKQVFTSDAFVYRDAFSFVTGNVVYKDHVLKATSTLTIKKPGDYTYAATPVPPELSAEGGDQLPEISWMDGKKAPAAPGEYGVVLTWRNVQLRDATADPSLVEFGPYFQVNRKGSDREQILRSFKVPVSAASRM